MLGSKDKKEEQWRERRSHPKMQNKPILLLSLVYYAKQTQIGLPDHEKTKRTHFFLWSLCSGLWTVFTKRSQTMVNLFFINR